MSACLKPRDVEALVAGILPARRHAAIQRHVEHCESCSATVEEARANEAWLAGLRDAGDLADLRRRLAGACRPQTVLPTELTEPPSNG